MLFCVIICVSEEEGKGSVISSRHFATALAAEPICSGAKSDGNPSPAAKGGLHAMSPTVYTRHTMHNAHNTQDAHTMHIIHKTPNTHNTHNTDNTDNTHNAHIAHAMHMTHTMHITLQYI